MLATRSLALVLALDDEAGLARAAALLEEAERIDPRLYQARADRALVELLDAADRRDPGRGEGGGHFRCPPHQRNWMRVRGTREQAAGDNASSNYWSATTNADNPNNAWNVNFNNGTVNNNDKTNNNYAWCVRGGP